MDSTSEETIDVSECTVEEFKEYLKARKEWLHGQKVPNKHDKMYKKTFSGYGYVMKRRHTQ